MTAVMMTVELLSTLFVFALGCVVLFLVVVYVLDRLQSRDAILRNYPIIGHLRHILPHVCYGPKADTMPRSLRAT
jgi:hypothetical protein